MIYSSGQTAGIYLHLPFCENLCPYCDFYSTVGDGNQIRDFPDLLKSEIDLAEAPFIEFTYDSIYLGGGTPSVHEANQIESILFALRSRFEICDDAEITIECNPSSLTDYNLKGYRAAGVNRLSLGVQSFQDRVLKKLGRVHDSKTAKKSYLAARRAGFDNINIDLIYGVPGQTVDFWERDVHEAIELAPDHISAYNLIIESDTEFGRLYRQGKLSLPDEDEQREMYYLLVDTLPGRGLNRYEISNFARDGKRCRHNLKYWTNKPYLGLGPSAVSFDGKKRVKNIADYDKYRNAVLHGISASDTVETISTEQAIEERIMMGLRLSDGVSISDLSQEYNYDFVKDKGAAIESLRKNGYLEITGDSLKITRSGLFLADEIMIKLM